MSILIAIAVAASLALGIRVSDGADSEADVQLNL